MKDGRAAALEQILALAQSHHISAEEIREAMREAPAAEQRSVAGRIFAWVGGIFILCGLGFFIESFWAEMNSAARIILSLGSGVVLQILALLMIQDGLLKSGARANLAVPLFLLAALFQAGGLMVAFDELGTGGDPLHAVLAVNLVLLAQALLVLRVHRLTVLVFLAFFFAVGALGTALEIIALDGDLNRALCGAALLGAASMIRNSPHRAILPFWYFVGAVLLSYAMFELLEDSPVHIIYVGYAALLIWLSTVARSRVLLFVGTCAMIGYLGYFTGEYFADSLGWPLALMIIGLIFIGLSLLAVRISRSYIGSAA